MGISLTVLSVGIMGFGTVVPEHVVLGLILGIIGVVLSALGK